MTIGVCFQLQDPMFNVQRTHNFSYFFKNMFEGMSLPQDPMFEEKKIFFSMCDPIKMSLAR